ncbi:MAG: hypothetical protein LBN26_07255 [Christensenellaceae bacterium]|jgi:hypothetical protein|nr:hypothetical protein [Christensenellaceae bacterium]
MNYFGLFFTFMIPGILMGIMAAYALRETKDKRHHSAQQARRDAQQSRPVQVVPRGKLYISTIEEAHAA